VKSILHYDYHQKQEVKKDDFLPLSSPVKILITSGASCPDSLVEAVIQKIALLYNAEDKMSALMKSYSVN
jgi:4-hydroxy-3-methylbut-2-enyl diphosphate reductase